MELNSLLITNDELRALIPNIIHEVEGEPLLVHKLDPWIESARLWLADNIVGRSFQLPEPLMPQAKRIIVYKAFAMAVPSLDLTLSPAGFAVISTEGRAPASKDRVERLVASLNASVDAELPQFLNSLLKLDDWRETPVGNYWLDTFMYGLEDAALLKKDNDLFSTYQILRVKALMFQSELEHRFLGKNIIAEIRGSIYAQSILDERAYMWTMLHRALIKFLSSDAPGMTDVCPDAHVLWHYTQPILEELTGCGELHRIWKAEMGDKFRVEPFKNTVKGGFFF